MNENLYMYSKHNEKQSKDIIRYTGILVATKNSLKKHKGKMNKKKTSHYQLSYNC